MAKDGRDGKPGPRGPRGLPGLDGIDGRDGQDADAAAIAAEVERRLAQRLPLLQPQACEAAAPIALPPQPWRAEFERDEISDVTTRVLMRARDGSAAIEILPVIDPASRLMVAADILPIAI